MNLNKVMLCGRLGKDPKALETKGGTAVTIVTLATSRRTKNPDGTKGEETTWHSVKFFGKTADLAAQYLKKGSEVFVEGRIHSYKYTAKDGAERWGYEIVADHMLFGARPEKQDAATAPAPAPAPSPSAPVGDDEDIPF